MKVTLIIILLFMVSGCAGMTPAEKKQTALIIGGIIVVGAIAANSGGSDAAPAGCRYVINSDGSATQICN